MPYITLWYRDSKVIGELYHDLLGLHIKAWFEADRSRVLNQKTSTKMVYLRFNFLTWCHIFLLSKLFRGKKYTMFCADDYEKIKNEITMDPIRTMLEGQIRHVHPKWLASEKKLK